MISTIRVRLFDGRSRQPARIITADEFAKIYNDFGYEEALDRDPASLSYTYDLGPDMRLLMLDSCQYSPVNKVGGMIKTETYDWIDNQLEKSMGGRCDPSSCGSS